MHLTKARPSGLDSLRLARDVQGLVLRGPQIHLPPTAQNRQLTLHSGHAQQAGSMTCCKLDQHVDIAVGTEIRP